MQERVNRVQSLFYLGLFVMLAAAILSAFQPGTGMGLLPVLTLAGAGMALMARLRLSHLQRVIRRRGGGFGTWAMR